MIRQQQQQQHPAAVPRCRRRKGVGGGGSSVGGLNGCHPSPRQRNSDCYYRMTTPDLLDDCGRAAACTEDEPTPTPPVAPLPLDGGEDSSSSGGGVGGSSGGGAGGIGQKRRLARSSSPLTVVTREFYMDVGTLLLGGGGGRRQQQQPQHRTASLGALAGRLGVLSAAMAMNEEAEEAAAAALEEQSAEFGADVGEDLLQQSGAESASDDGSLADESSVGQSSSPSPSPAPPASASAKTIRRRGAAGVGGSAVRRRAVAGGGVDSGRRRPALDARRLASKAERWYLSRSAGQLCASDASGPIGGLDGQDDRSGLDECAASSAEGPEDLDQLWDHYQPQPYQVGPDEATEEERLDDSHLQWEADQHQFGKQRKSLATEDYSSDDESAAEAPPPPPPPLLLPPVPSSHPLLASSRAALDRLAAELDAATNGCSSGSASVREEAARWSGRAGEAQDRAAELHAAVARWAPSDQQGADSLLDEWATVGQSLAALACAYTAVAEVEADKARMSAGAAAMQASLEPWLAACCGSPADLAERRQQLRDAEAVLHAWIDRLAGMHSRLEAARAWVPAGSGLALTIQIHLDQVVMLTHWLSSIRENYGTALCGLARALDTMQTVDAAVADCHGLLADESRRVDLLRAEVNAGRLGPQLVASLARCTERLSQADASLIQCRRSLADLEAQYGSRQADPEGVDARLQAAQDGLDGLRADCARLMAAASAAVADIACQADPVAAPRVRVRAPAAGGLAAHLALLACCCCLLLLLLPSDWAEAWWPVLRIVRKSGAPY